MSRWPFFLVSALVLLPLILIAGISGWLLWNSGNWFWLSWTMSLSWTAAWLVYRLQGRVEIPLPNVGSKIHWTPRDQAAAALIEVEQQRIHEFTGVQLADPQFYTTRTIELATEFARHYHPNSTDPLGSASVVELLTAIQLVAEDLEILLQQNVPGSHLMTVSQWKMLAQAPAWWRNASNLGWLASVVFNPTSLARYAVSRAFITPLSQQLQTNLLGTFYALFVRQLGFYLIELNSGRLRGGSAAYRASMKKLDPDQPTRTDETPVAPTPPVTVTIAVIGQVKAGKSSLINCLLGEQQAAVDVLPLTRAVQRYDLKLDDQSDRLILLDTPGYSDSEATPAQLADTFEAVRNADLVLMVLDVRSPAKQADLKTLEKLAAWFREQHRVKPPTIVGVVSKIDGLSPVMEWSPPYQWESPNRPKEHSIRAALDFTRQTFGDQFSSIVPVCSDIEHGRVWGIEEYLLPTVTLLLDEARACSLVRSLHRDYDREKTRQIVSQLISAGARIKELAPDFLKTQLELATKAILKRTFSK